MRSRSQKEQPHLRERLGLLRRQQAGGHVVVVRPHERAIGELEAADEPQGGRGVHLRECVGWGDGVFRHLQHRELAAVVLFHRAGDGHSAAPHGGQGAHADGAVQEVAARQEDLAAVRLGDAHAGRGAPAQGGRRGALAPARAAPCGRDVAARRGGALRGGRAPPVGAPLGRGAGPGMCGSFCYHDVYCVISCTGQSRVVGNCYNNCKHGSCTRYNGRALRRPTRFAGKSTSLRRFP